MRRRLLFGVPAVVLVAVATVAAVLLVRGPAINTGPFGSGGTAGLECTPGLRLILSPFAAYTNSGTSSATITKVALYRPRGLRVLSIDVVPETGTDSLGVTAYPTPLPSEILPGVEWSSRHGLPAVIPPHTEKFTVAVGVERTAQEGTAAGIDIFYEEAGQQYHLRTATAYQVIAARSCPP